jgi:hypothetical protein
MKRTFPTTLTHTKFGQERVMKRILGSPFLVPIQEVERELKIYIYMFMKKKREFFFPLLNHEVVKEIGSSITYQNGEDESYWCTSKPGTKNFRFQCMQPRKTCWIEEETKEFHALIFDTKTGRKLPLFSKPKSATNPEKRETKRALLQGFIFL